MDFTILLCRISGKSLPNRILSTPIILATCSKISSLYKKVRQPYQSKSWIALYLLPALKHKKVNRLPSEQILLQIRKVLREPV